MNNAIETLSKWNWNIFSTAERKRKERSMPLEWSFWCTKSFESFLTYRVCTSVKKIHE
jgi:hypothetical protein